MQFIWDEKAVESLRKSHTILELETFLVKGKSITAYCVVPAEKIGLDGFSNLHRYVELHEAFIRALKLKDYKLCQDASEHLLGQFGGELDTFYNEILDRIKSTTS